MMKTKKESGREAACSKGRTSGCLEQSGREGLNSGAIENHEKLHCGFRRRAPVSQGHLINRQQLSPFQMVIFPPLNASFSMPYCLLQQTVAVIAPPPIPPTEGFHSLFTTPYFILLVLVQAFLSDLFTVTIVNW